MKKIISTLIVGTKSKESFPLLLVISAVLFAGCTSAASQPSLPSPFASTTTSRTVATAPASTVSALLRFIPDTPDNRHRVEFSDYEKARLLLGLSAPPGGSPLEEVRAYVEKLQSAGLEAPAPEYLSDWGTGTWGYNLLDASQELTTRGGAGSVRILRGEFVELKIWTTLQARGYERQNYLDTPIISFGADFESKPDELPGSEEKHRIAVVSGHLIMGPVTEQVKRVVEMARKGGGSLAENPDFVLLVSTMERADVYAGYLTVDTRTINEVAKRYSLDEPKKEELVKWSLQKYQAWGLGVGQEAGTSYIYLVLAYADDKTAGENAPKLLKRLETGIDRWKKRPWTELFSNMTVKAEGRSVQARLETKDAGKWVSMLYAGSFDAILAHE